jgi:agmatinase
MIQLLGVPHDINSSFLRGAALAPPRIRLMSSDGSANSFTENGTEIIEGKTFEDNGDLILSGLSPQGAFKKIKHSILQLINSEDKVLSLGGDHSISFPIILATAEKYKNLNVLQLDAHGDLYENFDDNPFSHASPFARLLESGQIKSLTQVGIRSLNEHQRQQIEKYGVQTIEMKDFNMDFLGELEAPLYVSLDLDVLDPAFAPGVSHHEPGGMSSRQLLDLIQAISEEIIGADIVEYNPIRDLHNMTAMVAYKMMKELMEKMRVN